MLPCRGYVPAGKFMFHGILINLFQKPWAQFIVDFHGGSDDCVGLWILFRHYLRRSVVSPFGEIFQDFVEGPGVEDVFGGEPAFSGGVDAGL